jgi:hypothetical protein
METKNNNVVKKTKKKYKYRSPTAKFMNSSRDSSLFAIFIYILMEFVYFFYYLYKISPIYIKILFWLIILGLIIWFTVIKETNNSSEQPNSNSNNTNETIKQ